MNQQIASLQQSVTFSINKLKETNCEIENIENEIQEIKSQMG